MGSMVSLQTAQEREGGGGWSREIEEEEGEEEVEDGVERRSGDQGA